MDNTFHYEKNDDGCYERVGRGSAFDTSCLCRPWVTLHRYYYYNRDANHFQRIVSFITSKSFISETYPRSFKLKKKTALEIEKVTRSAFLCV